MTAWSTDTTSSSPVADSSGRATAYELARRGARGPVCDRADPGRATDAGAGILSPDTTERDDPAWVELCRLAGAHYDTLIPPSRATPVGRGAGS